MHHSLSMHIHTYPCISLHMHTYPCISVHMHTYPCISVRVHAYPCISKANCQGGNSIDYSIILKKEYDFFSLFNYYRVVDWVSILAIGFSQKLARISMHIHSYPCISTHIHAYACISMHIHTNLCICMHIRACACISVHIHAYPCISMHMHAYSSISMHIHAYACISVRVHAYLCISIHINAYPCICMIVGWFEGGGFYIYIYIYLTQSPIRSHFGLIVNVLALRLFYNVFYKLSQGPVVLGLRKFVLAVFLEACAGRETKIARNDCVGHDSCDRGFALMGWAPACGRVVQHRKSQKEQEKKTTVAVPLNWFVVLRCRIENDVIWETTPGSWKRKTQLQTQ